MKFIIIYLLCGIISIKSVQTDVADISGLTDRILIDLQNNFVNVESTFYSYRLGIGGRFEDLITVYTNAIQFVNSKYVELENEDLVHNSTIDYFQEILYGLDSMLDFIDAFEETMNYVPKFMEEFQQIFEIEWFEIRTSLSVNLVPCVNTYYSPLWRLLTIRSNTVRNCLRISLDILRIFYNSFILKIRQVEMIMMSFANRIIRCYNPRTSKTTAIDCVLDEIDEFPDISYLVFTITELIVSLNTTNHENCVDQVTNDSLGDITELISEVKMCVYPKESNLKNPLRDAIISFKEKRKVAEKPKFSEMKQIGNVANFTKNQQNVQICEVQ